MKKYSIYSVTAIGNFWSGRYYQQGLDCFFVLARTTLEAKEIASANIDVITLMFKDKILYKGKKRALAKKDTVKIKIGASEARETTQLKYNKVLTSNGLFEEIDLNID